MAEEKVFGLEPDEQPAEAATHPGYGKVFLILAAFTILEVAASYLPEAIKVPILIVLAATKAMLVLLYFMHLKYDNRFFSYPMIIGAVLVIPIILIIVLVMPLL